jgi:diguanylate cyclase (GGDEF)-like protein
MKKYVPYIYVGFVAIYIILLLYIHFAFNVDIHHADYNDDYDIVDEYDMVTLEDETAPAGVYQEYSFVLNGIGSEYRSLVFYTRHQLVELYLNDECIYSVSVSKNNTFGKTPGCIWNYVSFSEKDNGSTVRLVLTPVYKDVIKNKPTIYIGSRYEIMKSIIISSLPSIFLGLFAVIAGVFFVVFTIHNVRAYGGDKYLIMLGMFAINLGLWKMSDSQATDMIFPGHLSTSIMPFITLILMGVPYVLFLKELHSTKENVIWYIPVVTGFIQMAACFILQVFDIMDFRQTLKTTHIELLIIVVVSISMSLYELRTVGWSARLKRNMYCMAFCFFGLMLDLMVYYTAQWKSSSIFGMLGFMVYIIVLGLASMKEVRALMQIGMRARKYEQMAYHDELTGLLNRTAYAEHTTHEDYEPEHSIVVMCDLNNLKACNDTLGHDKGDVYIRESAHIIDEVFGKVGKCYRMGGDEFCILVEKCGLEKCRQLVSVMNEKAAAFNKNSKDVMIQIACGFEKYDKRIDYDIGDTLRRADRMMYAEKLAMKGKKADVR